MGIWNTIAIALGLRVEEKKIQPAEVAEKAKQMANSKPGEPVETTGMNHEEIETALRMVRDARDRFANWRDNLLAKQPYYVQKTYQRIADGHIYLIEDFKRLKSLQELQKLSLIWAEKDKESGKIRIYPMPATYEVEEFRIWPGIDPITPTWAGINNVSRNPHDLAELVQFRLENSPGKQYRIRGYIGTPPNPRPID